MSDEVKSGAMPVVLGGVAAVVIGVTIFLFATGPDQANVSAPRAAEQSAAATAPEVTEPAPEVQTEAPADPVLEAGPIAPEFDTFRVEPDGSMVIAGRAEPGQEVDIMLAGKALERVVADASGTFVALPQASPSDVPRRLSLLGDPDGAAVASSTSYIVAPIAAPVIVAAAPEADAPVAEEAVVAEGETVVSLSEPTLTPPTAPEVPEIDVAITAPAPPPTVLQADETGVRVVQGGPSITTPEADPNVALDAITYDPQGDVRLSGRATGDGAVQVYIDNEPLTASPVTEGGDWQIDLPQIDTGVYTLRIDEVDEEGDVISRLETPFKREEPEEVAAVLAEETAVDGFEVTVKTVQPGATLWAIAEENLGSGIFYVEVFEANSDLIRDPDLIYPGQIFRIPTVSQ